jgi:hypothetical protein
MRRIPSVLVLIGAWMATPVFAMEPPTSSTTPTTTSESSTSSIATAPDQSKASTASTTPNSSTGAPTDASATAVKLTAGDDEAAAQLKRFKAAGYKPEVHDGSVVFCRKETEMGSRFEKKTCTTAHLLEQQMARAQDTLDTAQRNGTLAPLSR